MHLLNSPVKHTQNVAAIKQLVCLSSHLKQQHMQKGVCLSDE